MRKLLLCSIGFCLATVIAGCGGSSTTTEDHGSGTATITASPTDARSAPNPRAPAAAQPTITISGMKFGESVTVPPRAQITVVNDDAVEHSVTSRETGKFDVHVDGNKRATFSAPAQAGEYPFFCTYHPSMTGTLIVT